MNENDELAIRGLKTYEIAVKGIDMRCDGDEGYKVYSNID